MERFIRRKKLKIMEKIKEMEEDEKEEICEQIKEKDDEI